MRVFATILSEPTAGATVTRWAPLAIVALIFCSLLVLGNSISWIPWVSGCTKDISCYPAPGETLSSVEAGKHYVSDGARYWYIERIRNPYEADSTVWLYTHNMNIGALIYYACALVIAKPFVPAVLLTLVAFSSGLFYAYLFVQRVSGSWLFATIFLLLLGSEYYFNLLFAFNLIRGWHWLALFGGAYHLVRGVLGDRVARRGHIAAFVAYTSMAFLIGYDFLVFAFFLSVLLVAFYRREPAVLPLWKRFALVFAAYTVPFVARQAQIIGGLGFNYWMTDLYYSAVIKTSFLSRFLPLPPIKSIDEWYRQRGVLRPFAIPETNVFHITQGFMQYFATLWLPRLGGVTVGLMLAGGALAVVLTISAVGARVRIPRSGLIMSSAMTVTLFGFAQALGLYFFAPLSVEIYVSHRFPMLIAFVLLAEAFVIYVLVRLLSLFPPNRFGIDARIVVMATLIGLAAYRITVLAGEYSSTPLIAPPRAVYTEYISFSSSAR